jgi:membrane protein YqaA with SNARE-associated domain
VTKSTATQPGFAPHNAELWIAGYPGMWIAFLLGFAEATFFFLIPDVFLSLAAILGGRRTWKHISAALAGALFGGTLLFQWSLASPAKAHAAVARVPFVREDMFNKVEEGFRKQGLLAVVIGSVTGIPYKLYAVEAPRFTTARAFLFATPVARGARFLAVWFLFTEIAQWLRRRLNWSTSNLLRVYAIVWIASYALYWGRIVFD